MTKMINIGDDKMKIIGDLDQVKISLKYASSIYNKNSYELTDRDNPNVGFISVASDRMLVSRDAATLCSDPEQNYKCSSTSIHIDTDNNITTSTCLIH